MENSEEREVGALPHGSAANLHSKRRGEVAELAFMLKAVSMGFGVAKPWGDSERYDFIVNAGRALWRVQIKSIWTRQHCQVNAAGNSGIPYTADEIDFLAAYLSPRDMWYVFPIAAVQHRYLHLRPDSRRSCYDQYREAWGLFGEASRTVPAVAVV